jgi:uncharacterized protein
MSQKNEHIVAESDIIVKNIPEENMVEQSPNNLLETPEITIETSDSDLSKFPLLSSLLEDKKATETLKDTFLCEAPNDMVAKESYLENVKYMFVGVVFGIVFVKGEVVSWFRIQEMFQFTSFHMFGVIGTAVTVGTLSIFLIKKFNIKTLSGEKVVFHKREFKKGQIFGGLIFGCGWALTGACPGPLFAQIGMGAAVVGVTLLSAIAGTWTYGLLRDKLPN